MEKFNQEIEHELVPKDISAEFLNMNVPSSIDHFASKANGDLEILVFSSFMSS